MKNSAISKNNFFNTQQLNNSKAVNDSFIPKKKIAVFIETWDVSSESSTDYNSQSIWVGNYEQSATNTSYVNGFMELIELKCFDFHSKTFIELKKVPMEDDKIEFFEKINNLYSLYISLYVENFEDYLKQIEFISSKLNQKIDLLILCGHGNPEGISFSSKKYSNKTCFMSKKDIKKISKTSKFINKNADILLYSCEVGKNTTKKTNSFAEEFKKTVDPSVTVHAPTKPFFARDCKITSLDPFRINVIVNNKNCMKRF